MTHGDVSSHLKVSALHVRFEDLIAREFGETAVRRMVSDAKASRSRPHDPATPVAWAAAAADRVAGGLPADRAVAPLGDLGVFCVALGSVTLLTAIPARRRSRRADRTLPGRDVLEAADAARLRVWAVELLPMVVDACAQQAPRWWFVARRRFARMVLRRLAVPE
ncbi:MAG: hypothetical protein RJA49_1705 [Actinomycetota bacterium]